MRGPNDFLLLSKAAVERFRTSSADFRKFLARLNVPGGPVREFPNGAIEISFVGVGGIEEHPLLPYAAEGCRLEGAGSARTLAAFQPKCTYAFQYPADYQERLRTEVSFHGGQGLMTPPSAGEFELANLRVASCFRTRTSKSTRRAFTDAIAAWGDVAADRGAFDDGPVRIISPGVTFCGTRAEFCIDASRSGQDTLNWLSLAILDFGYNVHPVTSVKFGSTDEQLDRMFGPVKGQPEVVPFLTEDVRFGPLPRPGAPPVTYVPPEAVPNSSFRSDRFHILTLPIDEWDTFVATAYFVRAPRTTEQHHFAALIRAWQLLGSYGAFGGVGIHSADEVVFDEASDSAIIRADMGDADPTIALAVLIRALEGFERGGNAPIDALVFGILA